MFPRCPKEVGCAMGPLKEFVDADLRSWKLHSIELEDSKFLKCSIGHFYSPRQRQGERIVEYYGAHPESVMVLNSVTAAWSWHTRPIAVPARPEQPCCPVGSVLHQNNSGTVAAFPNRSDGFASQRPSCPWPFVVLTCRLLPAISRHPWIRRGMLCKLKVRPLGTQFLSSQPQLSCQQDRHICQVRLGVALCVCVAKIYGLLFITSHKDASSIRSEQWRFAACSRFLQFHSLFPVFSLAFSNLAVQHGRSFIVFCLSFLLCRLPNWWWKQVSSGDFVATVNREKSSAKMVCGWYLLWYVTRLPALCTVVYRCNEHLIWFSIRLWYVEITNVCHNCNIGKDDIGVICFI